MKILIALVLIFCGNILSLEDVDISKAKHRLTISTGSAYHIFQEEFFSTNGGGLFGPDFIPEYSPGSLFGIELGLELSDFTLALRSNYSRFSGTIEGIDLRKDSYTISGGAYVKIWESGRARFYANTFVNYYILDHKSDFEGVTYRTQRYSLLSAGIFGEFFFNEYFSLGLSPEIDFYTIFFDNSELNNPPIYFRINVNISIYSNAL
ncbi:hypothetical protein OAQ99_00445 [Candidatus Kapabacteria bacterium]|nr:hypothetical protein [Candidatus Kapabacteria bacterium]